MRSRTIARAATMAALMGLIVAAPLAGGCAGASRGGTSAALRSETEAIIAKVKPSLVRITIVEPSYSGGREQKFVATGSGTIITPEGHVVTNHHVAGKAVRIICTMPNREEIPAVLVGTDAATDIAVIKLTPAKPMTFPVATWGDSSTLKVGDPILVMGSPLGLSQSVTRGIVSNTELVMPAMMRNVIFELDGENVGELVRWIGHDATTLPGNSGGPLVNTDGQLIGVNEMRMGLAGAIPGNLARRVATEIIERGTVTRAYTGLTFQTVFRNAEQRDGVLVNNVLKESPAEKAGFKTGDIVLSIGGTPVTARFAEDLPVVNNVVAELPLDKPVPFVARRGAEQLTLEVTPVQRQLASPPIDEQREWGLTARDLSMWTALSLARGDAKGVYITSTRAGGPAAKAKPPLQPGDVVTEIDGQPVKTLEDFEARTAALVAGKEDLVPTLVAFERGGESLMTMIEIGIEDLEDPGREVKKSWLPIETQVLTRELARGKGIPDVKGVRVTRVYGDAGEDFGIEVGDILTAMDDAPIEAAEPHDNQVFETMLRQYRVGSEVAFALLRGAENEKKTVEVKTLPTPKRGREMARHQDLDFGFILREATWQEQQKPEFADVSVALMIDSVTEGSWAAMSGLNAGDALMSIDGKPIASLDDAKAQLEAVHKTKARWVEMVVRRGVQFVHLEIEPMWEDR